MPKKSKAKKQNVEQSMAEVQDNQTSSNQPVEPTVVEPV